MKSKWIYFGGAVVILALLFWWSGQDSRAPKPVQHTGMGGMPQSAPHNHGTELPTVKEVSVAVESSTGENLGATNLAWQQLTPLQGTPYSLKVTEFYTQWNWDQHAINLSFEEQNPAAKIEVWQDGTMKYTAWAFKNVPFFRMTMHTPGEGASDDRIAFTLMTYDGLALPGGASKARMANPHEGAEG